MKNSLKGMVVIFALCGGQSLQAAGHIWGIFLTMAGGYLLGGIVREADRVAL